VKHNELQKVMFSQLQQFYSYQIRRVTRRALQCSAVLYSAVLCLYLNERRGVQGNTSMRSREFPRAQPEGPPETECWYFPVLPNSSQDTDIIQVIKVMKL
jgi:hypothetical protein